MNKLFIFFLIFASFGSLLGAQDQSENEFDQLMGKETSHWIYVKKAEDLEALEKFRALYEKNKGHLHQTEGEAKIPHVVHWIWLGPKPFPAKSVENVRSWIAKHPDWQFKFWTDRDRLPPCKGMEKIYVQNFPLIFLEKMFEQSENYGEKSDILRFEILYQEGGVYVDHDANCLINFDSLHRGFDFYCGLETPHPPFAGLNITSGNEVIGSRSFHPVIGKVLDLIATRWENLGKKYRGKDGYSRTQLVMERTYIMLTHALKQEVDKEGNVDIVLPAAYFFAKKDIPPLYSKHFFANAWADSEEKNEEFERTTRKAMGKLQQKSSMIRWIGHGAISLNFVVFISLFVYLIRQRRTKS